MALTILVTDDHAILRTCLISFLNNEPGLHVVGEAENGEQACRLVGELQPDILLLDISMPGIDGIETLRRIVKVYPAVRAIFLTAHDEDCFLQEGLRAGASGYVLKQASPLELVKAIHTVAGGKVYVDPGMVRSHPQGDFTRYVNPNKRILKPVEVLSKR